MKLALDTMNDIVIDMRDPVRTEQNMCVDKTYDFPEIDEGIRERGCMDHIRRRDEKIKKRLYKAKRWMVERAQPWHNRLRKLLVRFEIKDENYPGPP